MKNVWMERLLYCFCFALQETMDLPVHIGCVGGSNEST